MAGFNALRPLAVLVLISIAAVTFAIAVGSAQIGVGKVVWVLAGGGSDLDRTLILDLRLPRVLSAFAVGGLLAVAGALMQVLLRQEFQFYLQ